MQQARGRRRADADGAAVDLVDIAGKIAVPESRADRPGIALLTLRALRTNLTSRTSGPCVPRVTAAQRQQAQVDVHCAIDFDAIVVLEDTLVIDFIRARRPGQCWPGRCPCRWVRR